MIAGTGDQKRKAIPIQDTPSVRLDEIYRYTRDETYVASLFAKF